MVIESLLTPLGYIIKTATDGDEALSIVKSRDHLPDLVLLDVELLDTSGFEVSENTHPIPSAPPPQSRRLRAPPRRRSAGS